jgi:hypothetical protein
MHRLKVLLTVLMDDWPGFLVIAIEKTRSKRLRGPDTASSYSGARSCVLLAVVSTTRIAGQTYVSRVKRDTLFFGRDRDRVATDRGAIDGARNARGIGRG